MQEEENSSRMIFPHQGKHARKHHKNDEDCNIFQRKITTKR